MLRAGQHPNGTSGAGTIYTSPFIQSPQVLSWTKFADTAATTVATSTFLLGSVSVNNTANFDIDDYVIYAGPEDITAPDPVTSPQTPTIGSGQIALSWTAPGTGVDGGGFIVVRKQGSDPTTVPNVNGIYALGNSVAPGEQVVYVGTITSFTDAGLTPLTQYYYRIYTVDKAFNYSSAATINATTIAPSYATQPTVQASNLSFANVTQTQFDMTWTAGNGTNRLVIIRAGGDVNADPADGSSYTASTVFGGGSQVGAGNYVVYNGSGTTVTVTGLTKFTTYYVKIYEFNGSGGTENYLIVNPASGSQLTLRGEIVSTGLNGAGVSWNTASAWVGGAVPGLNDNVTVVSPDQLAIASAQQCYNLTINSGAKVYCNTALPTSSLQYLTIHGNSIIINGTLGDKNLAGTADGALGINFVQSLTISGTGLIRPARMRPNANTTNATLTIDANMEMTYSGSTGTGGLSLYTENSNNDNITITLNSGKTLSFVNYGSFGTANGYYENGTSTSTFNIDGTLNLSGANSNLVLRVATGKSSYLNINGSATVGGSLFASNIYHTANYGNAPGINVNGSLIVNGLAEFSDSAAQGVNVSGPGSFTLGSGARINIGAITGLHPVTGPIRTTTRSFSAGADYCFSASLPQNTGPDLPPSVKYFIVKNTAGVNLGQLLTADSLNLVWGKLNSTSSNFVTVAGTTTTSISGGNDTSYVSGPLARKLPSSLVAGSTYNFPIGKGIYKPLAFVDPVSTAGGPVVVSAEVFDANSGGTPGTGMLSLNTNRYWSAM